MDNSQDGDRARGQSAARLGSGALAAFVVAGPLVLLFPGLDIWISNAFFDPRQGFSGKTLWVEALRNVFKLVYIVACLTALTGLVFSSRTLRSFLGLSGLQHLFVLTCLAVGPGLVANLALKDQWGRARPREIQEFGGTKTFTAALVPARQCGKNCSFVSGEAASIFMVFFAFAVHAGRRATAMLVLGLGMGLLAGLIRISQGGHFFSDVIFAGITMAATVVAVNQIFAIIEHRAKPADPFAPQI